MNKSRKLQINFLSNSGQLLNCVTCFAGQVTVFRGNSPADIAPYQRALIGVGGPETFSIFLDGAPFEPQKHILIGFGERFTGSEGSVRDFLLAGGVPDGGLKSLLVNHGLDRIIDANCNAASTAEEHALRLLVAMHSSGKVLVLNNPFEHLVSPWRERFAEEVVAFARSRNEIVVVPSLSFRPDTWIDNESVARVQVGESLQKTIGFAGTRSEDLHKLLSEVRKGENIEEPLTASTRGLVTQIDKVVTPANSENTKKDRVFSWQKRFDKRLATLVSASALFLTLLSVQYLSKSSSMLSEPTSNAPIAMTPASQPEGKVSLPATSTPLLPTQVPPTVDLGERHALEMYPEHIKRSVMDSFEGKTHQESADRPVLTSLSQDTVPAQPGDVVQPPEDGEHVPEKNSQVLSALQLAENTGANLPAENLERPVSALSDQELEARREAIRQRFLEAVRRASEQQQNR